MTKNVASRQSSAMRYLIFSVCILGNSDGLMVRDVHIFAQETRVRVGDSVYDFGKVKPLLHPSTLARASSPLS